VNIGFALFNIASAQPAAATTKAQAEDLRTSHLKSIPEFI
jgi:hypothetical protein